MSRFIAATGILLAVTAALVGCTGEEEPKPQWTEESAYAAAEETFRAFWALGVRSDSRDEEAKLVTGDMAEVYSEDYESALNGHDIEFRGDSIVVSFVTSEFREIGKQVAVEADACVDSSSLERSEERRVGKERSASGEA